MQPPKKGDDRSRRRNHNRGKNTSFPRGSAQPASSLSEIKSEKTTKDVLQQEPEYKQKHFLEEVLILSIHHLQLKQDAWGLKERYLANQNFMVLEGRL